MTTDRLAIGLDFGTESVRAIVIDEAGVTLASAIDTYEHGQIVDRLPGDETMPRLGPRWALQHPMDWLESAGRAVRATVASSDRIDVGRIVGLGVDFTSCTMLPTTRDGTPLMMLPGLADCPHAWPKLWKHHGAQQQADEITALARRRGEAWIDRYGGAVGLEWLFPKLLEIHDADHGVYERADVFVEAGDWFVWWMIGGPARTLPRSTCQAGYKACWSEVTGFPTMDFLDALRPDLGKGLHSRLPGRFLAPGSRAGWLTPKAAEHLGLERALGGGNGSPGIAVSVAVIDAHSAVPGVGASEVGDLVLVLGTSACHMLNASTEIHVPGVAGIVRDGILPGQVGYEMGQAAVGDAFAWLAGISGRNLDELATEAAGLPAGSDGVLCLDWFNGCRTPLMNGRLTGAFHGVTLHTSAAHLYRAILEGLAFGCRWILELLEQKKVPVCRVLATGGLATRGLLIPQSWADILGKRIIVSKEAHACARGAAIYGLAAAVGGNPAETVARIVTQCAMSIEHFTLEPNAETFGTHRINYQRYRALADFVNARSSGE